MIKFYLKKQNKHSSSEGSYEGEVPDKIKNELTNLLKLLDAKINELLSINKLWLTKKKWHLIQGIDDCRSQIIELVEKNPGLVGDFGDQLHTYCPTALPTTETSVDVDRMALEDQFNLPSIPTKESGQNFFETSKVKFVVIALVLFLGGVGYASYNRDSDSRGSQPTLDGEK